MTRTFSRRSFLKGTVVAAGVAAFPAPFVMADAKPNSRLNCVVVGCGRRGGESHIGAAARERIVAFCDVDENNGGRALKWIADEGNIKKYKLVAQDAGKVKLYADLRKLLDEMNKDVDAVFIATPDHSHAWLAMAAMRAGKHVYCEKPLTYDISESRALAEAAKKYKVATQMGNQGHSSEEARRFCEYINAGAIGRILETHSWRGTQYKGGTRPASKPVPKGLDWDLWIGPAPFRDYHDGLHGVGWLGWWDFAAAGMLGGWGHHVLDPTFFALKPGQPTSVEMVDMVEGESEGFPKMDAIRWDFPANGDRSAFKMFWYDGTRRGAPAVGGEVEPENKKEHANRPAIVEELEKKYNRNFGDTGTIYVGEKGYMNTTGYGGSPRIVPEEKQKEFPPPPKTLPRVAGNDPFCDFIQACKGGTPPCSNFADYSGSFTEAMLVGKLAMKAGKGKKVEWDGANMKCTNRPELNQYVKREYRKGWELGT
jgi:hypothetical protein